MKARRIVTALFLATAGVACSPPSPSTQGSSSNSPSVHNSPTSPTVAIGGLRFVPKNVTVPAGTTLRWIWSTGDTEHNVTASNGEWKSGPPSSTGNFEQTFDVKGTTETYYCEVHGNNDGTGMAGTITVI